MVQMTVISLSPEELDARIMAVLSPLLQAIQSLETKVGTQRHAYTLPEVSERIGYSVETIRSLIKDGRLGRTGKVVKLKRREITHGDIRILPEDLDDFLSQF